MARDRYDVIDGIPVVWIPAPTSNYDAGRAGVDLLIIHDIEGSAEAGLNTLLNPGREASTHFIADPLKKRLVQMVGTGSTAWTAGNWYYNQRAIQIELPGKAGTPYDPAVIDYAGRWLGVMAKEFNVPIQLLTLSQVKPGARGITAHQWIPNPDNPLLGGGKDGHMDPGPTFPWAQVLAIAARVAGQTTPTPGSVPTGGDTPPVGGDFQSPATGYWCRGRFAEAYSRLGGLAVLGYPISRQFVERDVSGQGREYIVQYFERARLEWHPENAERIWQVLAGHLGREIVAAHDLAGQYAEAFTPEFTPR